MKCPIPHSRPLCAHLYFFNCLIRGYWVVFLLLPLVGFGLESLPPPPPQFAGIDEEFNRLSEQATAEMDVKSRDLNQPDHNEEALMHNIHQLKWPEKLPDHEAHHQSLLGNIPDFNDLGQAWRWRRRVQEAVVPAQYAGASTSGRDKQSGVVSELGTRATFLRGHHSPMRVYRVSETRVVLRVPHTGCKYRFTVRFFCSA